MSKRASLIALAVAALLVVGVGAALYLRDDGGAASGADAGPLEVVQRYLEAYPNRDCDALLEVLSEESWSDGGKVTRADWLARCQASQGQIAIDSAFEAVRIASETPDEAVVEIKVTNYDGRTATDRVSLRKQQGQWRVQQIG